MEPKSPLLSALRLAQPENWRRLVRTALKQSGSVPAAAAALNVSRATLFRWLDEEPALREGIELPDRPGRRAAAPPKKTAKRAATKKAT